MRLRIATILGLLLAPLAHAQSILTTVDTSRTVIFAAGRAQQAVAPDRATLTILIDAQAMSVDEASTRLSAVERAVMDTLRRLGLGSGLQAYTGGVAPVRQVGMPTSTGATFSGRSTIRVEVTRLDQITTISTAALAKGAAFIAAPVYTVSSADSIRRVLLPRALEQAHRDADALARAAGGRLGRLLDVNAQSLPIFSDQQQSVMFAGSMYYESGPRPIPNTTVVANVTARWMLIPGQP